MLLTRIGLFLSFGLIMATIVGANAVIAYRMRPRVRASAPSSPLLERYREMLESKFVWVIVALGVVVGAFRRRRREQPRSSTSRGRTGRPSAKPMPSSGWTSGSSSSAIRGGGSRCPLSSPQSASVPWRRRSCTTSWVAFASPVPAEAAAQPGPPVDPGRPCRAGEGLQLLVRPVRAGDHIASALHRHQLHRRQRHPPCQDDLGRDRRDLRSALPGERRFAPMGGAHHRPDPDGAVGDCAGRAVSRCCSVLQRPAR